jgi:hypothetical protein
LRGSKVQSGIAIGGKIDRMAAVLKKIADIGGDVGMIFDH